jgi:hypothetical protein
MGRYSPSQKCSEFAHGYLLSDQKWYRSDCGKQRAEDDTGNDPGDVDADLKFLLGGSINRHLIAFEIYVIDDLGIHVLVSLSVGCTRQRRQDTPGREKVVVSLLR